MLQSMLSSTSLELECWTSENWERPCSLLASIEQRTKERGLEEFDMLLFICS